MSQLTDKDVCNIILEILDDLKAQDPCTIDVQNKSSITNYLVVVTGTSSTHVNYISNSLELKLKEKGITTFGTDNGSSDWVVLDCGSVMVHVMREEARKLYALEKLWSDFISPKERN